MRIAVPLAIPVALGVTLGAVLAVSHQGSTTKVQSQAFGAPRPTTSTSTSTRTGTTGTTATTVAPASSFASGPIATSQLGDIATTPVDGTGAAINTHQTAAEAAASTNCSLAVPANPLTAQGLATPWQLGDGCSMANAGTEGAFVEATILSPTGQLSVYNPLVVTAGTQPAVPPVVPTIPTGSTVEISIGFNGTSLYLTGAGATQGNCVDALGQSVIGQVSACNAVNFYNAANAAIARGTLRVPAAGTATDGKACETTRDFALIDQDQSDNVVSAYLVTAGGQTAQATAANMTKLAGATKVGNGSDDALLAAFVDPANGCQAFTAPDITNAAGTSGSQALNELSARVNQKGTIALVPPNDEMTLVGGNMSIAKTNVYRSLVDQPLLSSTQNPATVAASYCQNMVNIAPARNQLDLAKDQAYATPVPATGNNLGNFLGNRLAMSFVNLNCGNYGLKSPATPTLDGNGVGIGIAYSLVQQTATGATTTTVNPFAGRTSGTQQFSSRRNFWQDPSGV